MQTTMSLVTPAVVFEDSAERSYLESLGELGFLKEIDSPVTLAQEAFVLGIQTTALTLLLVSLTAFLFHPNAHWQNHQLSVQALFAIGILGIANIVVGALAIRAAFLDYLFKDAGFQVVASDVVAGQCFTALFTLKPKSSMVAKAVEIKLLGSKVVKAIQSADVARKSSWTSGKRIADHTVLVAENLVMQAGQDYRIEQQLVIPEASSIEFKKRQFESIGTEYRWWVILKVKHSFGLNYVSRFPLYVHPQI